MVLKSCYELSHRFDLTGRNDRSVFYFTESDCLVLSEHLNCVVRDVHG